MHRLVYFITILGAWHFYWQVKLDLAEPLIYIGILTFLLGFRIVVAWRKRRKSAATGKPDHAHNANA